MVFGVSVDSVYLFLKPLESLMLVGKLKRFVIKVEKTNRLVEGVAVLKVTVILGESVHVEVVFLFSHSQSVYIHSSR